MYEWIKKRPRNLVIVVLVVFSLGLIGGGLVIGVLDRGDIGHNDIELRELRKAVAERQEYYRQITEVDSDLKIRLESIAGGLDTGTGLVEEVQRSSGSNIETLRVAITNLKKVKELFGSLKYVADYKRNRHIN